MKKLIILSLFLISIILICGCVTEKPTTGPVTDEKKNSEINNNTSDSEGKLLSSSATEKIQDRLKKSESNTSVKNETLNSASAANK